MGTVEGNKRKRRAKQKAYKRQRYRTIVAIRQGKVKGRTNWQHRQHITAISSRTGSSTLPDKHWTEPKEPRDAYQKLKGMSGKQRKHFKKHFPDHYDYLQKKSNQYTDESWSKHTGWMQDYSDKTRDPRYRRWVKQVKSKGGRQTDISNWLQDSKVSAQRRQRQESFERRRTRERVSRVERGTKKVLGAGKKVITGTARRGKRVLGGTHRGVMRGSRRVGKSLKSDNVTKRGFGAAYEQKSNKDFKRMLFGSNQKRGMR